ncbi:hypothetical protein ESA94_18120 [Lacibacter luteus]|uniref:Uncharacterized protein n=1 Tax=Lacibacter luteus TaxID=2508719 RepID=A0A4Q1CF68_9BACT|nr:hypothetical protein [Lacibacter luteus]RXK58548.1 hypothetical protein ESA94_18120 [Lacibacter luteus]
MTSYHKQTPITSYTVDKNVIEHLEEYLKNNVFDILNLESNGSGYRDKSDFSITLHDSNGIEKYASIKECKLPLFRNDIKGITIEQQIYIDHKELKVSLRFGDKQENSDLAISLTDDNAREKVSALEQGMYLILNSYKNINKVFYPPQIITTMLIFGGFFSGILALNSDYTTKARLLFGVTFFSIAFYCVIIPSLFKTFSSFDTNKQKQLDKWFTWLISAFLGFLVFSTVLTEFRRKIWGF